MNDFVSIVYVTFRNGLNNRDVVARQSMKSLLDNTHYPYELILVDNTQNNRGFSQARNTGARIATGKYMAFVDDDILFTGDWLTKCVELIEKGDKYMATPLIQRCIGKWELANVDGYRQNTRTGSNCMVMRRSAFDDIGIFNEQKNVSTAGVFYANNIFRKGYTFLLCGLGYATDLGAGKHSYNRINFGRKALN